jgi:tetratricopeptide (TPR) repeat protein
VKQFARQYNNQNTIHTALTQSKADRQYHDAVKAYDKGDMQAALDNFFLAIHSRYDIEHPLAKRFIRKKLNKVNELQAENERLREVIKQKDEEKKKQEKFLKRLATEYVIMGKECEKEGMKEAAVTNYRKALTLYPNHPVAPSPRCSNTTLEAFASTGVVIGEMVRPGCRPKRWFTWRCSSLGSSISFDHSINCP